MVSLHAFLALLTGFAALVAVGLVVTALLRRFAPQWVGPDQKLSPMYVIVNAGAAFLAAAAGGYLTAWAGEDNALPEVLALAIVVLALGAISTLQARARAGGTRSKQPLWYQMMLLVVTPLGVVAGGLLRLRLAGIL